MLQFNIFVSPPVLLVCSDSPSLFFLLSSSPPLVFSEELTSSGQLKVLPSIEPLFTRMLDVLEVIEGRNARFDCKVSGTPHPCVTWSHFGRQDSAVPHAFVGNIRTPVVEVIVKVVSPVPSLSRPPASPQ